MRGEAIIVLSLFNIFPAFSKHFLIEVQDKMGNVKTGKHTVATREYGADYGDNDEDYEDLQDDPDQHDQRDQRDQRDHRDHRDQRDQGDQDLFTETSRSPRPGEVAQCSGPLVRTCQTVRLNYENLDSQGGPEIYPALQ